MEKNEAEEIELCGVKTTQAASAGFEDGRGTVNKEWWQL